MIWVHMNLFELPEDNITIVQVHLDGATLNNLIQKCPEKVPENLQSYLFYLLLI